jgi:NADPH-dependent glutamate synthase beta subunit-like oxidoreductase/Pyruvate/2-oxoacid:ferredoxin oxidoreductase delta subunit
MVVSKAESLKKPYEQALEEAAHIFMETTPFLSTCGRVCPHPCETDCNRSALEASVGVNSFERFLGDFALEKKLVPKMLTEEKRSEKIAIIGSGPAGMTCAYHLARRGYPVTVFEAFPKSGGMLRYGIPDYRLPQSILDAEMQRILDLGVDLKLNTKIGVDISMDDLRKEYKSIFIGIGAHKGLKLRVDGEDAENVWTGTDFLRKVNMEEKVDVGNKVVVIGGGDTAIDAARVSRRLGAEATILYRRTREEMPAIDEEIEGALEEGVDIVYLAAPIALKSENGKATSMTCQRMELGEPDSSGRRRPVPIEGDTYELEFSTLIAAISQAPDFTGFEALIEGRDWIKIDDNCKTKLDETYSGGDNVNLGLAVQAIAQGRIAAQAIHEAITGEKIETPEEAKILHEKMYLPFYEKLERTGVESIPVEERFKDINREIVTTWNEETAIGEAKRCMSCGECFDCGNCWSLCQDNAVIKPLVKGEKYKFKLDYCNGCKKCAENCPCGYLEMH